MKIDFFARRRHFIDHLLPVYDALPLGNRGNFYIPEHLDGYAIEQGILPVSHRIALHPESDNDIDVLPPGEDPLVVCAYGDMQKAYRANPERTYIMMEHGVGLTPSSKNAGYAGGLGLRRAVDLFLAPNEYIMKKSAGVLDTPQVVIGTPKLDGLEYEVGEFFTRTEHAPIGKEWHYKREGGRELIQGRTPVVCISFHWNGSHVSPEAGNAFEYYKKAIPELHDKGFELIGHCHPKAVEEVLPFYEENEIPYIPDFRQVLKMADVYVNDCSSTMYEFLVTGKPVVILNAPHFRKNVYFGIRFWDYTDVGRVVERPSQLLPAILDTISKPAYHFSQRKRAVRELYPYVGRSAQTAAASILNFLGDKMEEKLLVVPEYKTIKNMLSGMNNSTKGISNAEVQHLSWLGAQLPPGTAVVEIGSHRGKSISSIVCGMRSAGLPLEHIFAVDLWHIGEGKTFEHYSSKETWEIFKKQIESVGLSEAIKPVVMESRRAAKQYPLSPNFRPIGLLFIDAYHYEGGVDVDYEVWHKFIASGGRIAFHDYGTRFKAVDKTIEETVIPSGLFDDFTVVGRIWSARKR